MSLIICLYTDILTDFSAYYPAKKEHMRCSVGLPSLITAPVLQAHVNNILRLFGFLELRCQRARTEYIKRDETAVV